MDSWARLFERAGDRGVDAAAVRDALAARREGEREDDSDGTGDGSGTPTDSGDRPEPSPARVVADADVLAADLFGVGHAREALDPLRAHAWTTLVASDPLLADAAAVVETLADPDLAADWRAKATDWREPTAHPPGDHPALASAYRGGAMHVLSGDERLTAADAGAGLHDRFPVSVREPRAFAAVFDAASLYAEVVGGTYPGPDRDPRA